MNAPPIELVCAELLTPSMFRHWLKTERAVYADIAHTSWAWAARWIDTSLQGMYYLSQRETTLQKITLGDDYPYALAIEYWLTVFTGLDRRDVSPQKRPVLTRTGAIERLDYIVSKMMAQT